MKIKKEVCVLGLFVILLSSSFSINPVYASTIESNGTGGGDWNNSSTWSGGVIPTSTDNVVIKSGDVIAIKDSRTIDVGSTLAIENGAELIIDGLNFGALTNFGDITIDGILTINGGSSTSSGKLTSREGSSISNNGSIILNGSTGFVSGSLTTNGMLINNNLITSNGGSGPGSGRLQPAGVATLINKNTMIFNGGLGDNAGSFQIERNSMIMNECDGTITMNGEAFRNGRLILFGSLTNSGIITLNGGPGDLSGELSLFVSGTLTNHNNIVENPGAGVLSGVINFSGGTFIEDPIPCDIGDIIVADNQGRLLRVSHSGSVTEIVTGLDNPFGVAIQSNGNIITTEASGRLLSVLPGGGFSVISDTGLGTPLGVDIDNDGNFIVVDNNGRLLKVTPSGTVMDIAPGKLSRGILDVIVDSNEDYIVTEGNGRLLKVTSGSVSEIANGILGLIGVEEDSNGDLIVVASGQLLRVSPDGTTVAPISPIPGQPFGVASDFDDNFLVTDQTGNLFRVVNGAPILIADNLGQPVFLELGPSPNNPPDCDFTDGPMNFPSFDNGVIVTSSSSTTIKNTDLPPFHKTVEIILSGITDVDGDVLSFNIDAITQDEPTSGLDVEDQSPDGFGVGTNTASIRVERDGAGDGRVYEVSFTAEDGNGGLCSSSRLLGIPHDASHNPINSGQNYDSSQP